MATDLERIIQDTLKAQFQTNPAFTNLPAPTRTVLNTVINQSTAGIAPQLVNDVTTNTNQQLDTIPKNLVGVNNPVNLVSSNLNATGLKQNVSGPVVDSVANPLIGQLTNQILGDLTNRLPPTTLSTLNIAALTGDITNAATIGVLAGVDTSLGQYAAQILSGTQKIQPVVPDVSGVFGGDPIGGLDRVNELYSASIATQAANEARNFETQSPENEQKLITETVGFIDPSATYPTDEYKNRAETNKLATSDVNGTIVQQKELERLKGIQLPNNESWEQPPIPYKGEYPYNKVIQTESGHVIEMDDTPGSERLHVYHRSGAFIEIDAHGNVVKKTKGSSYEIIDRNGYISVTGDAHLSVKGSIKIFVGGDANIEVEGDTNVKCLNDVTVQAAGRMDLSATEEMNLHSANINIHADVNLNMKGDVNAFLTSTDIYFRANSNVYHQVSENYSLFVGDTIFQKAENDINIRSKNDMYIQAVNDKYELVNGSVYNQTDGQYNIKSTQNTNIDGQNVYVNSGTSTQSKEAKIAAKSKFAISANIGLIGVRKDVIYQTIADSIPPSYLDKEGYFAEDAELVEDTQRQNRTLTESGIASKDDLDGFAVEVDKASPSSRNSDIIMPSDSLLEKTYLPDNFMLSKHFNLGSVSSKAVVTNQTVVAQAGLTYGQIVYNLQGVALNVLEPLLALYPNMFVTSAFRLAGRSATNSDHPKGKAVDIQFRNVSKADYYDIAKNLATQLNYDKLLLEYKTYGTGLPWIHISFDVQKPRKIVLTYLNDKKYGDGLISLA